MRPVTVCDGVCRGCIWASSRELHTLSEKTLRKLLEVLEPKMFSEVVLLCPDPLLHPEIERIVTVLRSYGGRISLFMPVNRLRSLRKSLVTEVSEIVLIATDYESLVREREYIKSFLSLGIEDLSIYFALSYGGIDLGEILATVDLCRSYGVRLRIGEIPYSSTYRLGLYDFFKSRGYEVALPYGYMYGYRASVAYIEHYRVVLLEKPVCEECRNLYLDPLGRVYRCPFTEKYVDLNSGVSLDDVMRILYSDSSAKHRVEDYIPLIEISMATPSGKVIPSDILKLLEVIRYTNSFRKACSLLGYNPSTYLEKIRSLEKELGFRLLITQRGGYRRGLTTLTYEATKILERYRAIREQLIEYLAKLCETALLKS